MSRQAPRGSAERAAQYAKRFGVSLAEAARAHSCSRAAVSTMYRRLFPDDPVKPGRPGVGAGE